VTGFETVAVVLNGSVNVENEEWAPQNGVVALMIEAVRRRSGRLLARG
jgi:hypothetical protein